MDGIVLVLRGGVRMLFFLCRDDRSGRLMAWYGMCGDSCRLWYLLVTSYARLMLMLMVGLVCMVMVGGCV